jgi:hypothetical protein
MNRVSSRHTVCEALVHTALNRQRFDSIADLTDVVKTLAAKYRIPYDSDLVAKAIRSVGSRRRLL